MRKLWLVAIVVLLVAVTAGWWVVSSPGEIDLTKAEALKLVDLQTRVVMSVADRDEFLRYLQGKYGVTMETHNLDIQTGRFVPKGDEVTNEEIP